MAGDPTLSRSLEIENCVTPQGRANPIDRETMRSINEIGHLTGKQMIDEWAENAEIIEVLRGLGVDYAQDYGVSPPQKVQRAAIA
jgi:EAL domain-containing protein (putative c-di-GMP-specific phosphodiesterase class I)